MTQDTRAFWNRVARRYAQMDIRNPDAYEQTLDSIRANLSEKDCVLELGCGTGTTAFRLAQNVRRYVASDYSSEMIDIAMERQPPETRENLDFHVGQIGDENHPTGPFNMVLCFNFLHLLDDRKTILAKIHMSLEPGGLFVSKTPCVSGLFTLLRPVVLILHAFAKAPCFKFLSSKRLETEIKTAGFEIIETARHPEGSVRHVIVAKKLNNTTA
ncbi:class I SAM-dependent methyltransferase [Gymnodinialimonas ulvae]|uniref:class I SAM-dependent methyltransferase n=1 Tax=Gymnodinialimonas ulvae TaxID=3126504 RepID=UPI00309907AD